MAGQPEILARVVFQPDQASADRTGATVQKSIDRAVGNLGRSGLGQISRDFTQFDRSLQSASARVLAFSATAGLILGVSRAFSSMVKEMVSVDKAMRDINVILGLSTKNFQTFGAQLFDVARNTGQSFKSISEGAVELSRQGLSASETLKRLRDAAILTRLSGLTLADSVEAVTASLNSFQKELLDSTTLVSKLAATDAAFSVSSRDLAESIKRVGSASEDAGIGINELIGLVTSARATTGREGPVIAQALNSVFSRIQRPEVIENLRSLSVEINNTQTGVQKLQALSRALDSASADQASLIRFQAGGVRNLNVLSALLKDVNNQYGIYARATQTAANASSEAQVRNEELNKSFATLVNRTGVNLSQISAAFGKLTIGPALEKVLGGVNELLEGAVSKDSNTLGEVMGKGILSGIGQFLSGPGLLAIGAVLTKLIGSLVIETGQALKSIAGINTAAKDRLALEGNITLILQRQPELINQALASETGLLAVVRQVNEALAARSSLELSQARATTVIAGRIASPLRSTKAVGYIPGETQEKIGAYAGGYAPGQVKEMYIPQLGKVVYNTAEKVHYFPGLSQPAIIPPLASKAGINYQQKFQVAHGFDPYKNEGLIPSYGITYPTNSQLKKSRDLFEKQFFSGSVRTPFDNLYPNGIKKYASNSSVRYLDENIGKILSGISYKDKVDLNQLLGSVLSRGNFISNKGLIPSFARGDYMFPGPSKAQRIKQREMAQNRMMAVFNGTLEKAQSFVGQEGVSKLIKGYNGPLDTSEVLDELARSLTKSTLFPNAPKHALGRFGITPSMSEVLFEGFNNKGIQGYVKELKSRVNLGEFDSDGFVPSFARGERYMGSSSVAINARGLLDELARDERRALIKLMEGASVQEIANEMNLPLNVAGTLLDNAKKSYATKYNLAKAGKLANEGVVPNYAYIPGVSQLVGRAVTNLASPYGYQMDKKISALKDIKLKDIFNAVVKDKKYQPAFDFYQDEFSQSGAVRDFAYRKMFGLKPRVDTSHLLTQTGKKTYAFNERTNPYNEILGNESFREKLSENDDVIKLLGVNHPVMAKYLLEQNKRTGDISYKDVFDIGLNKGEKIGFKDVFKSIKNIGLTTFRGKLGSKKENFISGVKAQLGRDDIFDDAVYGSSGVSNLFRSLLNKVSSPITFAGTIKKDIPGQIFGGLVPNYAKFPIKPGEFGGLSTEVPVGNRKMRVVINKAGTIGFAPVNGSVFEKTGEGAFKTMNAIKDPLFDMMKSMTKENQFQSFNFDAGGYGGVKSGRQKLYERYLKRAGINLDEFNNFSLPQSLLENKGLVPNYASLLGSIGTVSKMIPTAFSAVGGVTGIAKLATGRLDPREFIDGLTQFAQSPSAFVRNPNDLESIVKILNTVGESKIAREKIAKVFGDRVRNGSGFAHNAVVQGLQEKQPLADEDTSRYLKYRLLGGQSEPEEFFNAKESFSGKMKASILKKNRNQTYSLTTDYVKDSLGDSIKRSLNLPVGSQGSDYAKRINENTVLAYEYNLGRFIAKTNKAKTRAVYSDRWDVDLHSNEKDALNKYLTTGDKNAAKALPGTTTYSGNDVDSLLLREIVSKYKHSNPVTLKGVVKLPKDRGLIYDGLIPNYNALTNAISREKSAGINLNQIRVASNSQLKSNLNPLGLGVYNTRDEPMGLGQGINRALREKVNPKLYGSKFAADGNVPNFALDPKDIQFEGLASERVRAEARNIYVDLAKAVSGGKSARDASKEFITLSKNLGAVPKDIEKVNQSFQGIQDTFRNLEKNKLLTNIEKVQKTGVLYPSPGQNTQLFSNNVGGLKNVLAPQFAQLLKESVKGVVAYTNPIGPLPSQYKQPIGPEPISFYPKPIGPLPSQYPYQIGPGTIPKITRQYPNPIGPFADPNYLSQYSNPLGPFRSAYPVTPIGARPFPNTSSFGTTAPGYGFRPRQSLYSKFDSAVRNPGFQNAALFGSFLLPTLAGPIAEGIGNQTTQQRFAGQAVTSTANIGSYGLLGSQFGGAPGAIGGVAIGGLLEAPKVIRSFTDTIPDLQREIEKLTEQINQTNDGFSNIIQTQEKLEQYQKGNLNLTPIQYGNLRNGLNNQVSQLSVLFPKYGADIRRAVAGGRQEDITQLQGQVLQEKANELSSQQLTLMQEKLFPKDVGTRGVNLIENVVKNEFAVGMSRFFNTFSILGGKDRALQGFQNLQESNGFREYSADPNNRNLGGFLKAVILPGLVRSQYKPLTETEQLPIKELVSGSILQTAKEGPYKDKNLQDILIERFKGGNEKEVRDLQTILDQFKKGGDTKNFQKILSDYFKEVIAPLAPKTQFGPLAQGIEIAAPNQIQVIIDTLEKAIGESQVKNFATVPEQDSKRIAENNSILIRSFNDLDDELSNLGVKLKIFNEDVVARITRNLDLQTTKVQTRTAIRALQNQSNPFLALGIEKSGAFEELGLRNRAQISVANQRFQETQQSSILSTIDKLRERVFQSNTSNGGNYENIQNIKSFNNLLNRLSNPEDVVSRVPFEQQSFKNLLANKLPPISNIFSNQYSNIFKEGATPLVNLGELNDKTRAAFIENAKKELSRVEGQLTQPLTPLGTNRKILESDRKVLKQLVDSDKLSTAELQKKVESYQADYEKDQEKFLLEQEKRRAEIIESLALTYSSLVGDIGVLRKNAEQAYQEAKDKGLTGRAATRFENFRNAQLNAPLVRSDFRAGQINSDEYRQGLTQQTTSDLELNGQVAGKTLGELFKSSFNYNKRDFYGELIKDTLEVRDIMRSSFSSAFQSFTDGSKSASEAARAFGISIATNILNRVADIGFNSLVGGVTGAAQNLFSSYGKNKGGLIGYASGGFVSGGSGVRDDIPMNLSQGSYVLKRSSVNKYGVGNLNRLNFAGGGRVNATLLNEYKYSGSGEGMQGKFNIDPKLSVIGQTDENNPQNVLKFAREQDFYSYQKTIENYRKQVKQFDRAKDQRVIGAGISAVSTIGGAYLGQIGRGATQAGSSLYNKDQASVNYGSEGNIYNKNNPISAPNKYNSNFRYDVQRDYYSPSISNYGSYSNYYNSNSIGYGRNLGGLIKRYDSGGSVDNIPAMLTGGEYVMNPQTVNRYGVNYMNKLNSGGITSIGRYAQGGLVGNDVNSINPIVQGGEGGLSQVTSALLQLIKINEDIRSLQDGTKNKTNNVTNSPNTENNTVNSAPSVSITINMANNGQTQNQSQTNTSNESAPNGENIKKFAELMKNIAISTIIEQQRDQGLLSNTRR